MSGLTWRYESNCNIGWGWKEKGKIDWFAYKGDSEGIEEIKEEINKFRPSKDYSYLLSDKIEGWEMCGECEKFIIYNEMLKEKIWELTVGEELPKAPKLLKKKNLLIKLDQNP